MKGILENSNISWKAKGLYAAIARKTKEGKFTQRDLIKMSTDGETSVSRGMKELLESGYLVQERIRINGRFQGSVWTLPKQDGKQ